MVLSTALHFLTSQKAKNQVKLDDWFPGCKTGKMITFLIFAANAPPGLDQYLSKTKSNRA
jgi:hypothetical protein